MLEIFVKEIIWKSEWLKKLWCVWIFIIGDVIVEDVGGGWCSGDC